MGAWTVIRLRIGTGFCKSGDDPSVYIKYGEFLDYVITFELLKKASAP
jgi:hypothetical protein